MRGFSFIGTTLTLTGLSFGTSGSVTIGGSVCPILPNTYTQTQILCQLPAGQGTNLAVVITSGSSTSPPYYFSYSPPVITSISPSTGPTAGSTAVTILGTSFGSSGVVTIGGGFENIHLACLLCLFISMYRYLYRSLGSISRCFIRFYRVVHCKVSFGFGLSCYNIVRLFFRFSLHTHRSWVQSDAYRMHHPIRGRPQSSCVGKLFRSNQWRSLVQVCV